MPEQISRHDNHAPLGRSDSGAGNLDSPYFCTSILYKNISGSCISRSCDYYSLGLRETIGCPHCRQPRVLLVYMTQALEYTRLLRWKAAFRWDNNENWIFSGSRFVKSSSQTDRSIGAPDSILEQRALFARATSKDLSFRAPQTSLTNRQKLTARNAVRSLHTERVPEHTHQTEETRFFLHSEHGFRIT